MLKPFKFQIHPVLLEVDEDGNAVAEHVADPVVVYGVEALETWTASVQSEVDRLNEKNAKGAD